ncbi:hypothetical protein NEOLI_003968 [Neolecta irregularis DAH-3]|uniref:Uncharacterized protein n=1 Tax=Neolecta irregularis (strain DAH-3) TaxID=1198029 RepID=A0A1U7LV37_NEOID|nr:hypothetical protein NEOLI_003968 [Neolecta irregularis DAH-3]|eukprot:OLL26381.1 hypothetical protein NEOLI_003968 [Neolecta irregularis DAH-3]
MKLGPLHITIASCLSSMAALKGSQKYLAVQDTFAWIWEEAYQTHFPAPRNYFNLEEVKQFTYEKYKRFCNMSGMLPATHRIPDLEILYPDAILFMPKRRLFHRHPEIIARGRNPQTGKWSTIYTIDQTTGSKTANKWIDSPQGRAYMELELALELSLGTGDQPPKTYIVCKLPHNPHRKHTK